MTAVQDGPTSIRVTWTPPSPPGDTTGYRISYTGGGGSSGSVDVDGGNTNSHSLMGLTNGETYTLLFVVTASLGLPSALVKAISKSKPFSYLLKQLTTNVQSYDKQSRTSTGYSDKITFLI